MSDKVLKQKIRKSRVRVVVTYLMSVTYAVGAVGLIGWLMALGKTELALGIFSGVASTTASITAFWFGSRGSAEDRPSGVAPSEVEQAGPAPLDRTIESDSRG